MLRGPEAVELWMVPIAPGAAFENALRQEGFAPQGDESLRIEVLRVKRPESHGAPKAARPAAAPGRWYATW